ncbi:hypothetical protein [Streptomyces tendae]|uniref:hypothetical protein n=1 Tax=Streptomyces tendae TaxID=1932 RepID=UPI00364BE84F
MPAAVGTVWSSKEESAEQILDLVDINGTPITQLVADERGVIPLFWGPPGAEYLWIDFGVGRLKITSNSLGERFKAHTEALDPHNSKQYTDEQLNNYIPRRGAQISCEKGVTWTGFKVPEVEGSTGDGAGNVFKVETENGTPAGYKEFTRLKNNGTLYVEPNGSHVPLAIGQWETVSANGTALNISKGRAGTEPSVFRIRADGRVEAAGAISAPNLGTARLFSGPTAPTNPQVGDVWVAYGA